MKKKITGMVITSVFMGVPFFAIAAGTCSNTMYTTPVMCSNAGETWTPDSGNIPVSNVIPTGGSNPVSNVIPTGPSAQGTNFGTDPNAPKLQNPIKFNSFSELVAQITKTAVEILLPFVVLAFIWSGFLFVRAQGNDKELENAKKNIWWSIVGAFILMGAWGFATMISQTVQTLTN